MGIPSRARSDGARGTRLPNLVIAGAAKSGTTSLYSYLAQHPDICPSSIKETQYFKPLRDHRQLPPLRVYERFFSHCGDQPYVMEASPSYAFAAQPVIAALRETLGDPRVIISLRDPVRRLWSSYTWQKAGGRLGSVRSFEEYVDRCERQRRSGRDRSLHNEYLALSVGFYADYVGLWLDAFRDEMRIVFAEDLFRDPSGVTGRLCRWLGIDDDVAKGFEFAVRGSTVQPRSRALAKARDRARRANEGFLRRHPTLRAVLRSAYKHVNSANFAEVPDEQVMRRLRDVYHESNAALARQLSSHGYVGFPDWLGDAGGRWSRGVAADPPVAHPDCSGGRPSNPAQAGPAPGEGGRS